MSRNATKPVRAAGATLAYCFRSGQIGFIDGPGSMPDGALFLAAGPKEIVHELIGGLGRRAYDGVTLLVPGVPESESEDAAYSAFIRFFERVELQLPVAIAKAGL